jgi:hypothetical protein
MQGTPTDAPLRDSSGEIRQETMIINMGPQHPSTHGVLRLLLELDGETVITCKPIIGYLHTGIEKNTEYRTWMQGITYVTRADYLSPFFNELGYCLAVERLLGIEAPTRAQVIRVLFCEMNRISSHLVWLATGGLELGAVSVMLYGSREREVLMDVFESVTGLRMNHAYIRIGGVIMDIHEEGMDKIREFLRVMPGRIDEFSHCSPRTRSGSSGTAASACCRRPTRSRWASPVRCCAPPVLPRTCARTCRTAGTRRTTSTSRCVTTPMRTRAMRSGSMRCGSRCASSSNASSGSRSPGP